MRRPAVCLFITLAACGGGSSAPRIAPSMPSQPMAGVYVANVRSANVVHLTASGSTQLTLQGGISPSGAGVTSSGDIAVPGNQQGVLFFHPGQTTPFRRFTDAKLCATHGIAFDGHDDAFVFDPICSNIDVYDPGASGAVSPSASLHIVEKTDGDVIAFDVDTAGTLYVLTGNAVPPAVRAYAYDASSKSLIAKRVIRGDRDFPEAASLAADSAGNVFVSNADREIVEYDASGTLLKKQAVQGLCETTSLRAMTHGAGGYVFASNVCGGNGAPSVSGYDVTGTPAPSPAEPNFIIAGAATQLGITRESGIAIDASGGPADGTIYVSNPSTDTVNGYCFAACFGNNYPSSQIALGYPVMNGIQAVYFSGTFMYTTDSATPAISIFAAPSNSAAGVQHPSPIARILAPEGSMCGASYTVVDAHHDLLVSLSCAQTSNYIAKYAIPANLHGDVVITPTVFAGTPGPCTGSIMCNPQQMVLDARGSLYVTNYGNAGDPGSILRFSPSGTLTAKLVGADIHNPSGIALDPQGDLAVFSNTGGTPEIAFFSPPPDQATPSTPLSVSPIRVIAGPATQLGGTSFPQLVIDRDGTIYADVFTEILVFASGASGNAAPSTVFKGPALTGGTGLALAP